MKRIFLGLALCAGMLFMGATSASAAIYCSDDPTLGIGLPINYSLNLSLGRRHVDRRLRQWHELDDHVRLRNRHLVANFSAP